MANTSTDIYPAITAANENFMATFLRGDAAGMASLYTDDGQLLPTNSEVVSGSAAIQAFWQAVMHMGIKAAKLETVELEDHGDTAHEIGRYTLHGEGNQLLDQGKYIVIWKRVGGEWKFHRDIWNTSQPAG
jgi:uncharacterized protein (TIGR02246 family)